MEKEFLNYQVLIDVMAEGLIQIDKNGLVTMCNKAAEKILGFSSGQMLGKDIITHTWSAIKENGEIFPVSEIPALVALKTGKSQRGVIVGFKKADGNLTWVILNSEPIFNEHHSEPIGVVASFTDITQTKLIEKRLLQSEENYRHFIDTAHQGFMIGDREQRIVEVNKYFYELLGYTSDEMVGRKLEDFLNEKNRKLLDESFKLAEKKTNRRYEIELTHKNGSQVAVILSATSIFDDKGEVVGTFGFCQDITNIVQIQKELVQFRTAIEQSPSTIVITDIDGKIEYVNPKFEEVTGYSYDEVKGQTPKILKTNLHDDAYYRKLWDDIEAGKTWQGEFKNKRKDGTEYWENATIAPIFDEDGTIVNFVAVKENITARKNAEFLLRESEEKYRFLTEGIRDTIWCLDVQTQKMTYVSPSIHFLLGYTEAELDKIPLLDLMPAQTQLWFVENLKNRLDDFLTSKQKNFYTDEVQFFHKDGRLIWVEILSYYFLNENKNTIEIIGSARDTSARKLIENELRTSEERFRNSFEFSGIGMALVSTEGKWLQVNKRLCDILGYTQEELKQLTFQDITHPEDLDLDLGYVQSMLKGEIETYEMEKRYFHKTGKIVWVLLNVSMVCGVDGKPLYFISQINNITIRKKYEVALTQSEQRFRALFESASVMVCLQDQDGQILTANQKTADLTGYSIEELCSMNMADISTDYVRPDSGKGHWDVLFSKGSVSFEASCKRKDGAVFPVAVELAYTKMENETMFISVVTDITDRKQYEIRILDLNRQLEEAQKIAKIGSWINNLDTRTTVWSNAVFSIFGYLPNEKQSDEIFKKHIHNNDREIYKKHIHKSIQNGLFQPFEFRIIDRNGTLKWCRVEGEFRKNGSDKFEEAFGTIQDITVVKNIELELKETIKTKDKFFSIISHDLRSPFSSLLGLSELLVEDVENELYDNVLSYAVSIRDGAKNLFDLLNNLLSWARVQTDKMPFNPSPIRICDLSQKVIEQVGESARMKQIDLTMNCHSHEYITVDKNMIQTVMRNLLSNAIKFTPKGGKIEMETRISETEVRFSVCDSGVGISNEQLSKLFGDELKSTPGTNNEPGTGLGLILCKDFVSRHKGRIWAESNSDKGKPSTTFFFTIPIN